MTATRPTGRPRSSSCRMRSTPTSSAPSCSSEGPTIMSTKAGAHPGQLHLKLLSRARPPRMSTTSTTQHGSPTRRPVQNNERLHGHTMPSRRRRCLDHRLGLRPHMRASSPVHLEKGARQALLNSQAPSPGKAAGSSTWSTPTSCSRSSY
jgi:hypothetical protein